MTNTPALLTADRLNAALFGRKAKIPFRPNIGTVVRSDDAGRVLVRWDSTTDGLSWHKVYDSTPETILVEGEATPTMHQVAQAARRAAAPPLIGGLPA
jgi:hypothetical protein